MMLLFVGIDIILVSGMLLLVEYKNIRFSQNNLELTNLHNIWRLTKNQCLFIINGEISIPKVTWHQKASTDISMLSK